jgi:hypothetical protein
LLLDVILDLALLNQGMNANCASHSKVSLGLGFKNLAKEDSYLKSATLFDDCGGLAMCNQPYVFIFLGAYLT